MVTEFKVSRHGLTCCPHCKAHIKLAHTPEETVCPFCKQGIGQVGEAPAKVGFSGKGKALLAATLLGASISFVACTGTPGPQPAYGIAPTEQTPDGGQSPDLTAAPAYGIAPTEQTNPDSGQSPDIGNAPAYGIAP